jgi:NAD-dependent deacetylase
MRIVVLTGAGVSAESGVPTFRDADGLWEGHRLEEVATPEAFEHQPVVVHRFYDARRAALAGVEPNPAHRALARLEEAIGDDLLVVTQNVDDLHERAGSTRVLHMHGRLRAAWCRACDGRTDWYDDLADCPPCPRCGATELRPDVVWFGEVPYEMDRIVGALRRPTSSSRSGPRAPSTPPPASWSVPRPRVPELSSSTSSPAPAPTSSTTRGTVRPPCSCRSGSARCCGSP